MTYDSTPARRDRAHEPSELARAAARRAGRCITVGCGNPAAGQRCDACRRRIEANTDRYRGKGTQGPPTQVASEAVDLRLAAAALADAAAAFGEAARAGMTPREAVRQLAEPLAKAVLADKLLRAVIRKRRAAEERLVRPPPPRREPQLAFRWPEYMGAR